MDVSQCSHAKPSPGKERHHPLQHSKQANAMRQSFAKPPPRMRRGRPQIDCFLLASSAECSRTSTASGGQKDEQWSVMMSRR
ncbi:uncharacterized protein EI90DRAFT_1014593 [Cantharellus anzutake]|uniref:uncharacterized protein n=1 Tax=Cantharellus anzutake TaxID=1750568 RepID=UPI001906D735|nr:uncharacterized protein EI90DRAFT_1014593 [Cantharellus anzutake]KAF8331364.1 hypothetical protein EI90DRAFT_1014593 [Cantharellus anzutake]